MIDHLNLDNLFQDVTNEPSDCKYYNLNVFNDLQTKNEDLLLLSTNIASLNKNQFKLENLISQAPKSPDIIAVTETKIRNANNISNAYNIDNYEFIHNDTPTHFGGVGFYINEKLEFKTRRDLELNIQSCEDMWIEVETKNKKNTVFGVIYRHPKHNLNEFRDKFAQALEKITNENKKMYISGDYNINLLNVEKSAPIRFYYNTLLSFACRSIIDKPTRVTSGSATLIGHI